MNDAELPGGLTNPGSVVRDGSCVLRPGGAQSVSVHAYLRSVRDNGFDGVPMPVGIEDDGRERLEYIDGDVPMSPYPAWSQSDEALASIVRLLRQLHDASCDFDMTGHVWNPTLADPVGNEIVCHNDVELSNVVFRDGVAVGLIDFEFAAPGRAVYDLAQLARVCVPIEHEVDRARMGWLQGDGPNRLRLVADTYGLDRQGRTSLLGAIEDAIDRVEAAAHRNIASSDATALAIIDRTGGIEKYDRRRRWWALHRPAFAAALE